MKLTVEESKAYRLGFPSYVWGEQVGIEFIDKDVSMNYSLVEVVDKEGKSVGFWELTSSKT